MRWSLSFHSQWAVETVSPLSHPNSPVPTSGPWSPWSLDFVSPQPQQNSVTTFLCSSSHITKWCLGAGTLIDLTVQAMYWYWFLTTQMFTIALKELLSALSSNAQFHPSCLSLSRQAAPQLLPPQSVLMFSSKFSCFLCLLMVQKYNNEAHNACLKFYHSASWTTSSQTAASLPIHAPFPNILASTLFLTLHP